jgi:methylmalonyl-CoA/ethylmalonyl-CoA epimerase
MRIRKLDHICIAVWSIADACRLYVDVLGAEFIGGGDNPRMGMRAVQLRYPPGGKVELLEPLSQEGWLYQYLQRYGPGFHHLTFYTDDVLEAEHVINEHGFDTVDTDLSYPSWKETFTRPSSTFGIIVQLATPSHPWDAPLPEITLVDVLEGRVQILENVVSWKATGHQVWPPVDGP